jgi:hypothetical protein
MSAAPVRSIPATDKNDKYCRGSSLLPNNRDANSVPYKISDF